MNREDFPMLKQDIIYLDNGATSFKPQCVIDKIVDYYSNYSANAHRGDYDISYKVDLEYELTLVTTTNLPVEYEIYLSDSPDNIITSKEIYQDEDGMYFYKFHTPKKNFTHDVKQTDNYKLVVNFPEQYKSSEYQNLLESATIYIDSKQM